MPLSSAHGPVDLSQSRRKDFLRMPLDFGPDMAYSMGSESFRFGENEKGQNMPDIYSAEFRRAEAAYLDPENAPNAPEDDDDDDGDDDGEEYDPDTFDGDILDIL